MENDQSYKITPEAIVNNDMYFCIPLYQRLFTWSAKEVRQLMDDLYEHFIKEPEEDYHIGMITVVKQNRRLDLIDGQQRITALVLLAIGFMKCLGDSKVRAGWSKFFDNAARVHFNGRSQDRRFLNSLAHAEPSPYNNINMLEGLACIKQYLEDRNGLIQPFAETVFRHLTIFVTQLPKHYVENPTSLNEYFEAMNSSGKSLEQHEILKVELLRNYHESDKLTLTRLWNVVSNFEQPLIRMIDRSTGCHEVNHAEQVRLYHHFIDLCHGNDFEEAVSRFCIESRSEGYGKSIAEIEVKKHDLSVGEIRDKEDSIISFPQFLLLVLALHHDKDEIARVHPTKLYDTFKDNPISNGEIESFYHELLFYRLLMDLYVVRVRYTSSASYHDLISINTNNADVEAHAHNRLRQFQAMLDVSTEPHIWLLPLLKHLKSIKYAPSQSELLDFLMKMDRQREGHDAYPEIEKLDYSSKPRYWLWRLDYAIWEKLILEGKDSFGYPGLDPEIIRQYEFRANRSIEHLHPQEQSNNDTWERKDVDSFGNLAMISQSFNSQQNNLPVHVKFANLEVQIKNKSLQSLKLYLMYLIANKKEDEWSVSVKDKHGAEMLEILKKSLGVTENETTQE